MIWSLLCYPFVLAARRPRGVFGPLGIGLAVALALDIGFAAGGVDTFSSATGWIWDARAGGYDWIGNLVWLFLVGFVMGVALTDLGERTNDRATLDDGLGLLALNAVYGVVVGLFVYLPLQFALEFATSLAGRATPDIVARATMEVAADAISLLAAAYVSARLSFSGPLTLIRGKIVVFSAWPETRGRVLKIIGSNVAAFVAIGLIAAVGSIPGYVLSQGDPEPVQSLAGALAPRALVEMLAKELTIMAAIGYYAATQAYVFHRLKERESATEDAARAAA
jgi:hypothetical protein